MSRLRYVCTMYSSCIFPYNILSSNAVAGSNRHTHATHTKILSGKDRDVILLSDLLEKVAKGKGKGRGCHEAMGHSQKLRRFEAHL